jgi:YD repeat-containing protein
MTDANSNSTTYGFDALNRLVSITNPLGFAQSLTFDANGNIATITDANGDTTNIAMMPWTGRPASNTQMEQLLLTPTAR